MSEFEENGQWQKKDVWLGVLFLIAGVPLTAMPMRLLGHLSEPEAGILLVIGGLGWLSGPFLLILEANAVVQSLIPSKGSHEEKESES